MAVQVTTEVEALPGRRVLAVKRATGAADVERLRREARILERGRHPDVVDLVSFRDGHDAAELRTVYAGSHSLATVGPLSVERAAGVVAAVAATLADLHEIGVTHGRLEPSHVLLGPAGRPMLCGFGDGDGEPADDVSALGSILTALIASADDELEPIPTRRFARRLRHPWPGVSRRALLNVADQASADDPRHRPTARALAAAIRATVPDATLTTTVATDHTAERQSTDRVEPDRRMRIGAVVAVGVGVVVLIAGIRGLGGGATTALLPTAASVATTTTRGPVSTEPSAPPPTASTSEPVCPDVTAADLADIDGDGCAEAVTIGPNVIEVAGARYQIGIPGDELAVGDWDCDGRATAALLRPRTGEVFVFRDWAALGEDVTVVAFDRVDGGRRLVEATGGDCGVLVVERADGSHVAVTA